MDFFLELVLYNQLGVNYYTKGHILRHAKEDYIETKARFFL